MIALWLLACGGSTSERFEPAPIGLCLAPDVGWDVFYGPMAADPTGTVTDVGTGFPPSPCGGHEGWVTNGLPRWGGPEEPEGVAWVRFEQALGDEWVLAFYLPDGEPGLRIGDPIGVDFQREIFGFAPDVGSVLVESDGRRVAWISAAGEIGDLSLPDGISAKQGDEIGRDRSDCGRWSHYATEITIDGSDRTIDVGETRDVGGAVVTVGSHAHQTSTGGCPDWFVADVSLGGWN